MDAKSKHMFYELELLKRCWQINFRNRDYLASVGLSFAPAFDFFSRLLKHAGIIITKQLDSLQGKALSKN